MTTKAASLSDTVSEESLFRLITDNM